MCPQAPRELAHESKAKVGHLGLIFESVADKGLITRHRRAFPVVGFYPVSNRFESALFAELGYDAMNRTGPRRLGELRDGLRQLLATTVGAAPRNRTSLSASHFKRTQEDDRVEVEGYLASARRLISRLTQFRLTLIDDYSCKLQSVDKIRVSHRSKEGVALCCRIMDDLAQKLNGEVDKVIELKGSKDFVRLGLTQLPNQAVKEMFFNDPQTRKWCNLRRLNKVTTSAPVNSKEFFTAKEDASSTATKRSYNQVASQPATPAPPQAKSQPQSARPTIAANRSGSSRRTRDEISLTSGSKRYMLETFIHEERKERKLQPNPVPEPVEGASGFTPEDYSKLTDHAKLTLSLVAKGVDALKTPEKFPLLSGKDVSSIPSYAKQYPASNNAWEYEKGLEDFVYVGFRAWYRYVRHGSGTGLFRVQRRNPREVLRRDQEKTERKKSTSTST